MLETGFPRIPGDIGNPETFALPVQYRIVKGASIQRAVRQADKGLLNLFVEGAQELERQGAQVLFTSCGFLALFQRQLAKAVDIPVYSSALMQIPHARKIVAQGRTVGVITADRSALTLRHFKGVGVDQMPSVIIGMEKTEEFSAVFLGNKSTLDVKRCRAEMAAATRALMAADPRVGAIVLECTNMPPYRDVVRKISRLQVFVVLTLIDDVVLKLVIYHP